MMRRICLDGFLLQFPKNLDNTKFLKERMSSTSLFMCLDNLKNRPEIGQRFSVRLVVWIDQLRFRPIQKNLFDGNFAKQCYVIICYFDLIEINFENF